MGSSEYERLCRRFLHGKKKVWNPMVEIVTAALNCIVQSMQKLAKGMDI
jgi:hypothetical protein